MTPTTALSTDSVGILVRTWRERRRRSQLDVSIAAEISTRHLSYIETGRSRPSPEMIERISEELEVPLRERNRLHLAAGFAPAHAERPFADLGLARTAVEAVLSGLEPNPAVAVNVRWDVLATNSTTQLLLADLPETLTSPRLNMLRATLSPEGLAPRIHNLDEWRAHVLRRVRRQLERTSAEGLAELLAELEGYGGPATTGAGCDHDLVVPMQVATQFGDLALLYTVSVFGSPRDVTLDEIAIETFFPADATTAGVLRSLAELQRPDHS